MARVTVEDCILNVPNRFELVLLSAKRAREISAGAALTVARDNDKNPVVALREISEHSIDIDGLRDNLVRSMQRHVFVNNHEDALDQEVDDSLESMNEWDEEINAFAFSDDESGETELDSDDKSNDDADDEDE